LSFKIAKPLTSCAALGAAVGYIRERVVHSNTAAGNAGFIFWFDIFAPLMLIVLYTAT
jgi:hypothetical protein